MKLLLRVILKLFFQGFQWGSHSPDEGPKQGAPHCHWRERVSISIGVRTLGTIVYVSFVNGSLYVCLNLVCYTCFKKITRDGRGSPAICDTCKLCHLSYLKNVWYYSAPVSLFVMCVSVHVIQVDTSHLSFCMSASSTHTHTLYTQTHRHEHDLFLFPEIKAVCSSAVIPPTPPAVPYLFQPHPGAPQVSMCLLLHPSLSELVLCVCVRVLLW